MEEIGMASISFVELKKKIPFNLDFEQCIDFPFL